MKDLGKEGGIEKCRNIFEEALNSCALHVSKGILLWGSYKDFEAGIFGMDNSNEQEERYKSICRRQLGIPLIGMEENYLAIKDLVELDQTTEGNYKDALTKLKSILPFEKKLVNKTHSIIFYLFTIIN